MIGMLGTMLGRLLRERRAVAVLELALVLPLILIMFFGTVEITQVIRASNKLNIAAESIENMIAGQKAIVAADVANAVQGGQLIMAPFPATLAVAVYSVNFDSSGHATSVGWQVTTGVPNPALSLANVCTMVAGLSLDSDSVILVHATYQYSAVVHYILPASFKLSHDAYGRPRFVNAPAPTTGGGSC